MAEYLFLLLEPSVENSGLPAENNHLAKLWVIPDPGGARNQVSLDLEVEPLGHRALGQEERLTWRLSGGRP